MLKSKSKPGSSYVYVDQFLTKKVPCLTTAEQRDYGKWRRDAKQDADDGHEFPLNICPEGVTTSCYEFDTTAPDRKAVSYAGTGEATYTYCLLYTSPSPRDS